MKKLILFTLIMCGASALAAPEMPKISWKDTRRLWCLASLAETKRIDGPLYDVMTSVAGEINIPNDAFTDNGKNEEFTLPLTIELVLRNHMYGDLALSQSLRFVHIDATMNKAGAQKSQLTHISASVNLPTGFELGRGQGAGAAINTTFPLINEISARVECHLDALQK